LYYITPGQTKIDVKVNESFIFKLRVCHSCGYRWVMQKDDTLNVKLISVRQENASGRIAQIGGDVYEFWKFIVGKIGNYNIEFIQKGPGREFKENGRFNFEIWVY
jgi:predicted secreted protein